jgi:hypothetical protein
VLGFRNCFTPRQGYFSVFARATGSLSVSQEYLGLEHGRPRFTQDFTSLALLRIPFSHSRFVYGPITLCGEPFQVLLLALMVLNRVLQPQGVNPLVWPLPLSLAATGGISSISFPLATKMFQFTRFASACADTAGSLPWVAPFGHPGITDSVHLPPAFRSLARPSSPLRA